MEDLEWNYRWATRAGGAEKRGAEGVADVTSHVLQ